jgi:hypothetical protein
VAPEAWLLTWFCVTTMNPACMKWDGVTEQVVTSVNSEVECASYPYCFVRVRRSDDRPVSKAVRGLYV